MRVTFTVNGELREADDVWEGLLYVLRADGPPGQERLRAGRVRLVHGLPRRPPAARAWSRPGRPTVAASTPWRGSAARTAGCAVQQAYLAGAVQCGFCTPGLLVATRPARP